MGDVYYVAVLAKLDYEVVPHNNGQVFIFREEAQFNKPVQTGCAVLAGPLTITLPRAKDGTNSTVDDPDATSSIRWYSRTGPQAQQAEAIVDVVILDLVKENSTDVIIVLALEERNLEDLDWGDTFPLLIATLEKVMLANIERGTSFKLIAAPMLYPIGDKYKALQAKVASHNASVAAFNYYIRGVRTVDLWKFATNTKARPDSTLKLAVMGMEHFSLTPSNYDEGPRAPSRSCLLRIRKKLRKAVRTEFAFCEETRAPYKLVDGAVVVLPAPTASDNKGEAMDPITVINQRVEALHLRTPEREKLMMPMISTAAYEYISTTTAQERVDRRREALGLERPDGKTADTGRSRPMACDPRKREEYHSSSRQRVEYPSSSLQRRHTSKGTKTTSSVSRHSSQASTGRRNSKARAPTPPSRRNEIQMTRTGRG